LDSFDEDDTVSLDGFHPKIAERKIEEKLEALLSPDATSLFVKIRLAKRAPEAKKQKPNVLMLLDRYVWFAKPQPRLFKSFAGITLLYIR
jgi:hypothetical protein